MKVGDKVTASNYKKGNKVKRSSTWSSGNQDAGSIYGIIINKPEKPFTRDEEVKVMWIDKHNYEIGTFLYIVGRGDIFDLEFAEETVNYSIDDMFADLDALADRYE